MELTRISERLASHTAENVITTFENGQTIRWTLGNPKKCYLCPRTLVLPISPAAQHRDSREECIDELTLRLREVHVDLCSGPNTPVQVQPN